VPARKLKVNVLVPVKSVAELFQTVVVTVMVPPAGTGSGLEFDIVASTRV
jgi:hypothetical protein